MKEINPLGGFAQTDPRMRDTVDDFGLRMTGKRQHKHVAAFTAAGSHQTGRQFAATGQNAELRRRVQAAGSNFGWQMARELSARMKLTISITGAASLNWVATSSRRSAMVPSGANSKR